MDIERNALNARWQAIEARLKQIAAASCLDQELGRPEPRIEKWWNCYLLAAERPVGCTVPRQFVTRVAADWARLVLLLPPGTSTRLAGPLLWCLAIKRSPASPERRHGSGHRIASATPFRHGLSRQAV
jgi:hypothetical protein